MTNSERRNKVRRRYRAKGREDEGQLRLTRATAIGSTKLQIVHARMTGVIGDLRKQLDQLADMREKNEAINFNYALEFSQRATVLVALVETANHLRGFVERSTE